METTSWIGSREIDLKETDQTKGLPQPPIELGYDKTKSIIDLPAPKDVKVDAIDLREAIEKRVSVRSYAKSPISLEELSWLLWCTQGVKGVTDRPSTLRMVPSAGSFHPFETYLLVNRVEGLSPGLYRFLAIEHKLVEVSLEPDLADRITEACWRQLWVKESAVTFLWTLVVDRIIWRYRKRGLRNLIEAGHVCQNLYLSAEAVRCGVCAIGGFGDKKINDILGIDGEEQAVVYIATVGKRK
jgi:SagB-type dehydrogenase family enzyme